MRTIDAEKLHDTLFRVGGEISLNSFLVFEKLILDAPTINTTKHGEWLPFCDGYGYKCSVCCTYVDSPYNYCPYCGAEMK